MGHNQPKALPLSRTALGSRADTPCWLARLTPLSVPYLVRGSECCRQARAENPGGIVGRCLVGIVSGEINRAAIIGERRGQDRPGRHQRLTRCGRTSDLSELVAPARISGQKPRASVEPAVTDIDDAMAARDRRSRRDERLETHQKQVAALRVADLCHVIVGGYDIADPHLPRGTEKSREIEFGGLAAILRV